MFCASTTGRGNGVVWPTHSGIQIYYVTAKRHKNAYLLEAFPKKRKYGSSNRPFLPYCDVVKWIKEKETNEDGDLVLLT